MFYNLFTIENEVESVKKEIDNLKVELEKAKQDRKNHEEHVAFAKKVREFPSRAQSIEDIEKTRAEIEQLEDDKKSLDEKTQIRSKQLHLLLFSIQQLLTEIDLDKKDDEVRSDAIRHSVVDMFAYVCFHFRCRHHHQLCQLCQPPQWM